jgi:hypothetical protein
MRESWWPTAKGFWRWMKATQKPRSKLCFIAPDATAPRAEANTLP